MTEKYLMRWATEREEKLSTEVITATSTIQLTLNKQAVPVPLPNDVKDPLAGFGSIY